MRNNGLKAQFMNIQSSTGNTWNLLASVSLFLVLSPHAYSQCGSCTDLGKPKPIPVVLGMLLHTHVDDFESTSFSAQIADTTIPITRGVADEHWTEGYSGNEQFDEDFADIEPNVEFEFSATYNGTGTGYVEFDCVMFFPWKCSGVTAVIINGEEFKLADPYDTLIERTLTQSTQITNCFVETGPYGGLGRVEFSYAGAPDVSIPAKVKFLMKFVTDAAEHPPEFGDDPVASPGGT